MSTVAEPKYHTSGAVRLTRPQLVGTLTGLLLTMLLAAIDQTIVGTAEPRIIASLSGFNRYPWVATAYLLTSTLAVPIFAKLSDIYGRKRFFMGGAILFVLASALCGASGDLTFLPIDGMNQLILFRGIQGIGAGTILGLIFTIVGDIFSPAERGRYQGFFSGVWGLASIFGPTLGGWLTDSVSWRACFYVNLPVGIIAIAAIHFQFPDLHSQGLRKRVDWAGVLALTACIVPLLLALTWVTDYGWSSQRVESLLIFAAVMLAVFINIETRAEEPLIPLSLFRNQVIGLCSVCSFLMGMGMFGVIIYLPLFIQGVLGRSATQSGNLLTPMMIGVVCGTFTSGQTVSRLGSYKLIAVAGSVLVALGMIQFARMTPATLQFEVVRGMVTAGFGMGLLMPVYMVAVQNAAPRHQLGAATASTAFFRSIGSTMGVAVFGSVLLTNYHREFANSVPAGTPAEALKPFTNPVLLVQMRAQIEETFKQYPDGVQLFQTLLAAVRNSLVHGLQLIFLVSAILMSFSVILHAMLKNVPLRKHGHASETAAPASELV